MSTFPRALSLAAAYVYIYEQLGTSPALIRFDHFSDTALLVAICQSISIYNSFGRLPFCLGLFFFNILYIFQPFLSEYQIYCWIGVQKSMVDGGWEEGEVR